MRTERIVLSIQFLRLATFQSETLKRRFMLTCLKNGGPCAVSSRAWCSFFNVMRLGPIVSATGCCSVPFFASKEVLSTLVSHGNSLRSIQLNRADRKSVV